MYFICISGKARTGKDTFGKILVDELNGNWVTKAYADILKNKIMEDYELTWDQLYGDLKEVPDKRYSKYNNTSTDEFWTPREIMQAYGEFFRSIDPDFWVKALMKDCINEDSTNIIITDVRYPNELDPINRYNGIHIRIHRDHDVYVHNNSHSSETALDTYSNIDLSIDNNGSIEDLVSKVENVRKII